MTETADLQERRRTLAALLVDLERPPLELIEEIREARERLVDDPALAQDVARAELAYLNSVALEHRHGDEVGAAVTAARYAAQVSEFAFLQGEKVGVAPALFDLAELRAQVAAEGDVARHIAIGEELDRRVQELDGVGPSLRAEARERYVSLGTDTEDLTGAVQVATLREMEELLRELGTRFGDRELRSLARRVGRMSCDRKLARRIETVLSPRGAAILENTSLVLLLVVFGLLAVESAFDFEPATLDLFQRIDAGICVFFVAEFCFKLALAPARVSWFLRNFLTDLLPALPGALWFTMPNALGEDTVLLRALRILRLPIFRLLLFMAKGADSLVHRFSTLLNRNLVFFDETVLPRAHEQEVDDRVLAFRALRREQVLIHDLPMADAQRVLLRRAQRLARRFEAIPSARSGGRIVHRGVEREIPVEHAIEDLYALRPERLAAMVPRDDVAAIDRIVRTVNAPVLRWLPILSWFRSKKRAATPEERVVNFGRRIAAQLERWRERALYVADLHGIVTGPQVLDRLASAMVKASMRPARNLILFGLFFLLVRLLIGPKTAIGLFLSKFVATPVLVLGSVCVVVLALGFWLKKLAGEAADQFKMTSEASFIGLTELMKRRSQDADLDFLARRVFRWDMDSWEAAGLVTQYVRAARTGVQTSPIEAPEGMQEDLYQVALLYLHFLDGSLLHESDVKTNDQLLANFSLENIRGDYLRYGRRDRRRLRKLWMQSGALFGGPYLWFRSITESVALETAKRITDYNRNCLPLKRRSSASPEERAAFASWLKKRNKSREGRLEHVDEPSREPRFLTTEFNALDFLSIDPMREEHVERVFGARVLKILRNERKTMIREIFGTRPLHEKPRSERTLNPYEFYMARLSRGRIFLAPLHAIYLLGRSVAMAVRKTTDIVREILAPDLAHARRISGRAPFAVALRKIGRMRAPTLLETMRLRAAFDPSYCGAPPTWSSEHSFDEVSEIECDMNFLEMRERDRAELRELAETVRRRVEELHGFVRRREERQGVGLFDADPAQQRRGERAVSIAYVTDRSDMRTLWRAERWFERELQRMESSATRLPARTFRRFFWWLVRGFRQHPVDRFFREQMAERSISRRGRLNFKRAWLDGDEVLRRTLEVWQGLPAGESPERAAITLAEAFYKDCDEVSREITALRAVQSISVLDVRNYRRLVFDLGDFAADGESRASAEALP